MEPEASEQSFPELEPLVKLVEEKPEGFAFGDAEIKNAALAATKFVFDLGMDFYSVMHVCSM